MIFVEVKREKGPKTEHCRGMSRVFLPLIVGEN